jgi:hypothetical protein
MAHSHGDRWKYTAEYDQWLKGKNPHGLKSRLPHALAKRERKS